MTAPLVRIADLTLRAETARGTATILRGIDLEIGRGRILGIVGESGSGKSSLAACLLRLLPANGASVSGRIDFDGTDLLALDDHAMGAFRGTRIAMIFQDPMTSLNPLFTVGTHMVDVIRRREPAIARGDALDRAEAMLRKVAIADARARLGAYPHQLSGGMRQRVMIAMALLAGPDLLLADEPTTALDATVEAQIVALMAALRAEFRGSVVFISHHLGLVAELCDDLCVLYGGSVLETGPVAAVLEAPRHPYTRALLACEIEDDASDARLASIPGGPPDPVAPQRGCIFAPRCGFVAPRCLAEVPHPRASGPDRTTACHRFEELA